MAIRVRLTNKSQGTRELTELVDKASTSGDAEIILGRELYQTLGSLIKNRQAATVDSSGDATIHWEKMTKAYRSFAEDMNSLWLHTYYPELAASRDIPTPTDEMIALDKYLGSLGVDTTYIYSKDFVNITPWVTPAAQDEVRPLVDLEDNTYLTDSNGTEFLVQYT